MRILIVVVTLVCATTHSDSTTLPSVNVDAFKDWHRELDANALILPEFSIEAKTAGEALRLTMGAYGVSINAYLNSATLVDTNFHYRRSNVSLATVLGAIGDHYGLKVERDEDTGVSWLLPEAVMLKNVLSYHVTVEEARPGLPLFSGLLATLVRQFTNEALKDEKPNLAVVLAGRGFVGAREASFDIPTNVQAGRYRALDILHYCNQLAPWLSFSIWEEGIKKFSHNTITPMQVSGGNCTEPTPGWTALWKIATNDGTPDFARALQAMLHTQEYGVFGAHLAKMLCRNDDHFLKALNSASTLVETANVFNSYASTRKNIPGDSLPAGVRYAGERLLAAGFYEEGPASIALPLLLNMAVAQRTQAVSTKFLTEYAGRRAFSGSDLRGAEAQIGKAAYISEAVWRALMDPDAASYFDTDAWAATFLPEEFSKLEYQNFLPGQQER